VSRLSLNALQPVLLLGVISIMETENDWTGKSLTPDQKWELISRGIERGIGEGDHVIGEPEIREILKTRDLRIYWGTGWHRESGFFLRCSFLGPFAVLLIVEALFTYLIWVIGLLL
jgi:hypothetical protein